MSGEIPLQFDLFSGDLVDTRTESQKRKDREHSNPQQMQMFTTPEMVQFGNAIRSAYKEWLDQATPPGLTLEIQDVRTPEEIERDCQRAAEALTMLLFASGEPPKEDDPTPTLQEHTRVGKLPPYIVGYRARQRYVQAKVRRRVAPEPT